MKTLYGKLKVPKIILKLPALIFLFLALAYNANAQSNSSPVCYGSLFTLYGNGGTVSTAGATTYQWQGPNGFYYINNASGDVAVYPGNPQPGITYPGLCGSYVYTLTVSYPNPIPSQVGSTVVTLTCAPEAIITTTGPSSTCSGTATSTTYGTSLTNRTNGGTFSWTVTPSGPTLGTPTTATSTVTNWGSIPAGTYTITLSMVFGSCATVTTNTTFIVNALPATPVMLTATSAVCSGTTGKVYSVTAVSGLTYSWTVQGGTVASQSGTGNSQASVNWGRAGTGTITITATNTTCSALPATYTVSIGAPPAAPVVTGLAQICTTTATYDYTVTNNGDYYLWNVTGFGTNTPTVTQSPAGSSSITVSWVGNNYTATIACTASGTVCSTTGTSYSVGVHVESAPAFTGAASACLPATSTKVYTITSPVAGTTYHWNAANGTADPSTGNSTIITFTAAGTASVTAYAVNAYGCTSGVYTASVSVGTTPTPTISGPATVCQVGGPVSYYTESGMGTTYSWEVNANSGTPTIIGAGTNNTITIQWPNAPGTGTVRVSYINGGCAGTSAIYTVTITPNIAVTITGADRVCEYTMGSAYTCTAFPAGATYQWNAISIIGTIIATGPTSSNTTVNFGGPGPATDVMSVTVNYNGCVASATKSVLIGTLPGLATFTTVPVCSGAQVNYTADMSTTGATAATYSWTIEGGAATATTANPVQVTWPLVSAGSSAIGTITLNWTTTYGCAATPTVKTVTIWGPPVEPVMASANVYSVCANGTGSYSAVSSGPNVNPATGYTWSSTGSITGGAGSQTITLAWGNLSSYTLTVKAVNSVSGCFSSVVTKTIMVNQSVTPTITAVPNTYTVCNLTSSQFNTDNDGTQSGWQWTVSNSVASIVTASNAATVTIQWKVAAVTTVSVLYYKTLYGITCGPFTNTITITVKPLPVPTITPTSSTAICAGVPGWQYFTEAGAGISGWSWTVTGPDGTSSSSNSQTVTVTWGNNTVTPQTGTVTVNYSLNGCPATNATTFTVTINPNPGSVIYTTKPNDKWNVCQNSTWSYYTSPGANTYYWLANGPNGTYIPVGGGQGTYSVTVNWGNPGYYYGDIRVQTTSSMGCVSTSTVQSVTVTAMPRAASVTSTDWTVCSSDYANNPTSNPTSARTYYASLASQAGVGYQWQISSPNGASTFAYTITTSLGSPNPNDKLTVKWLNTGTTPITGVMTVTYVTTAGCTATPTVWNVTINPLPNPTVSGTSPVCAGQPGVYSITNIGAAYNTPVINYSLGYYISWLYTTAPNTSTSTSQTLNVTWPTAGTQSVSVNYYNTYGCTATKTTIKFPVVVNIQPVKPVISGPNACVGTTATYSISDGTTTGAYYVWTVSSGGSFVNGNVGTSVNVKWNSSGPGTLAVTSTYTSTSNCYATSDVYTVTVYTLPVATINGPSIVCPNTSVAYWSTTPNVVEYNWVVTGGTAQIVTTTNTYSLTVTWGSTPTGTVYSWVEDNHGCVGSTQSLVTIEPIVPLIAGDDPVCGYGGDRYVVGHGWATYTTTPNMRNYVWTVSSGVASTTGQGTDTFKVLFTDVPYTGEPYIQTVTVIYTGDCTPASPSVKTVTINPVPQPVISGIATICQNSCQNFPNGYAYYGTALNAGSTYEWSVSGGIIYTGYGNGNSIYVCWTTCPSGTVQVTETNLYGCTTTSEVFNVTVLPTPAPVISGPLTVNTNATADYYTAPYANRIYTWNVVGGTIVLGQGTNSITVDWGPMPACWCGSVSVCESSVGQNNMVLCTGCDEVAIDLLPTDHSINGYISYKNGYGTKLNGVEVFLRDHNTGAIVAETQTGPNMVGPPAELGLPGYFAFVNIPLGTVTETLDYDLGAVELGPDNPWGGNNATDALLVQLYLAGSYPLDPLNHTVADVNGSTTITSLDALHILLRTVGLVNYYPAGDWMFDAKHVILEGSPKSEDLNGLCVGDVNGSYVPSGMKAASLLSSIEDGVQTVPVNASFTYDLRSNAVAGLGAMTLFMSYDESKFEIEKVSTVLEGMKYTIGNGLISLAWSDTRSLDVKSNDVVISLQMKAKSPITEATQVFALQAGSEFADAIAQPFENFELKMAKVVTTGNSAFSLQNYPNPFKNSTDIVYTLPETGTVTLIVTDMLGKTVSTLVNGETQNAGTYRLTVNAADGKMNPGVYLYRIQVEGANASFVKTNKMTVTH